MYVANFLKSILWSASTPKSQAVTCGVEFHVNSNSSCVSACFPVRCTACLVVSVCHSLVSGARLLTDPDVSSTSALSQLKTFAHRISQQNHTSMKDFTETDVPPTVGDGDRRSDARGRTEHDWVQDACHPKRSRGCRGEGANGEDSFGTPSEVDLESQIEKSAKNYTRVKPTQQQAKEHTQQQGTRTWPTANETRVSQKLSQLKEGGRQKVRDRRFYPRAQGGFREHKRACREHQAGTPLQHAGSDIRRMCRGVCESGRSSKLFGSCRLCQEQHKHKQLFFFFCLFALTSRWLYVRSRNNEAVKELT